MVIVVVDLLHGGEGAELQRLRVVLPHGARLHVVDSLNLAADGQRLQNLDQFVSFIMCDYKARRPKVELCEHCSLVLFCCCYLQVDRVETGSNAHTLNLRFCSPGVNKSEHHQEVKFYSCGNSRACLF